MLTPAGQTDVATAGFRTRGDAGHSGHSGLEVNLDGAVGVLAYLEGAGPRRGGGGLVGGRAVEPLLEGGDHEPVAREGDERPSAREGLRKLLPNQGFVHLLLVVGAGWQGGVSGRMARGMLEVPIEASLLVP